MDAAPRMPQNRGRVFGRSTTNEEPRKPTQEEERVLPPLEIFVKELPAANNDGNLDVSSSALTEITFDGSFNHHQSNSVLTIEPAECVGCGGSVTSDVSSKVDRQPPLLNSSSGGERIRLPPRRRNSCQRGCRTKRGVMRWSSMPKPHVKSTDAPDATHTPRLPTRKGSDRDLDESNPKHDRCSNKELPRLPTRRRSSDSLFSNVGEVPPAKNIGVPVSANAA